MLDELDIKILRTLQSNGRTKRNVLAEQVGLSVPSVSERLKKLEESGIIEGYHAKVKRQAFGFDILAFIFVLMDSSKHYKDLIKHVEKHPSIIECYSVLGEGSHILKVIVKNTEALEKLLSEIQTWTGVKETTSINI